jgi:hypothetical protein
MLPSPNTPHAPQWIEEVAAVSRTQAERMYKECSALKIQDVEDVFEVATRGGSIIGGGLVGKVAREGRMTRCVMC